MAKTISATIRVLILLLFTTAGGTLYAQNNDINILKDINTHRNRSLDALMGGITNSVYPVSGIIPVTELAAGYIRHDTVLKQAGYTAIAGLGINFIVTFGLKYAVNRPRPYTTYSFIQPYQHDKDPSFPSGHSSFSFNTATSLFLVAPRWYVAIPAYAWATTVAYSRLDLGMHYPTDVFAGAVIGAGTAIIAKKGNEWLHHHKKRASRADR
jgi:undecaprenyl-diphosphatase